MQKVMVAMSGGVDSSVAAKLLQNAGYDIIGITLKLFADGEMGEHSTCCSVSDVEDARSVCHRLDVPHYVFNFSDRFNQVIERFIGAYKSGQTPNPCIDCNRLIKFDELMRRVEAAEADYFATGHYARIQQEPSGRYILKKALDADKDQSYVLYALTQKQLSKTLLPLGALTKAEVRAIAEENAFLNADKPDSQDICFVPDGDYGAFIERHTGEQAREGNFIDINGRVLGKHNGIIRYTIGQRKKLGIALGKPMYVKAINPAENTVTLCDEHELYSNVIEVTDINLIAIDELTAPLNVTARLRYRMKEQKAIITPLDNGNISITFTVPQRAATSGQAAVFYDGDTVIGGGTIKGTLK